MLFLIKIQDSELIDDMYSNEYLYFKPLQDFRSHDNDKSGRNDPRELNVEITQLKTLTLELKGEKIHLHEIAKEFNAQYNIHLVDPQINCCSLHWLELNIGQTAAPFDSRLLEMGNKILLIYDWRKFFEILDASLENHNYQYSRKKVTYYDPKTQNGELTLHHKDKIFSYQNEYRILIGKTNREPIKLPLPGLKSISFTASSTKIDQLSVDTEEKN